MCYNVLLREYVDQFFLFVQVLLGYHRFFEGEAPYWFKSMIFVTGVRGNVIMGTPLFLVLGADPTVRV